MAAQDQTPGVMPTYPMAVLGLWTVGPDRCTYRAQNRYGQRAYDTPWATTCHVKILARMLRHHCHVTHTDQDGDVWQLKPLTLYIEEEAWHTIAPIYQRAVLHMTCDCCGRQVQTVYTNCAKPAGEPLPDAVPAPEPVEE